MFTHSRQSPSKRYLELLSMYQNMHSEGDPSTSQDADNTFDGQSLLPHVELIGQLITHFAANTLLDYGAGKGKQYGPMPINLPDGRRYPDIAAFWGVSVHCYDPGHKPFSTPPGRQYDAVISTDVLEHCPEEDLEWIVDEMFGAASKFLYANAACYPADKQLPNGENAHITIRPLSWWSALFAKVAAAHPGLPWLLSVEERVLENHVVTSHTRHAGTINIS